MEAIIKNESGFGYVAGTIKKISKGTDRFSVTLEVPGREDPMEINFWNEKEKEGADRKPIAWADIAERKNPRVGSCVCAAVVFDKNDANKASGRRMDYAGCFFSKETNGKNAIFGAASNIERHTSKSGNDYISINVYAGMNGKGEGAKPRNLKVSFFQYLDRIEEELKKIPEGKMGYILANITAPTTSEWEHPVTMELRTYENCFGKSLKFIGVVPEKTKKGAVVETA